jgi:hypothetical protein
MSLLSEAITHIADLDLTICLINATNWASTFIYYLMHHAIGSLRKQQ